MSIESLGLYFSLFVTEILLIVEKALMFIRVQLFFCVRVCSFHFILGAAVGFVLLTIFLSMFVELGVQTSLTMQDTRWVGNWWLGFAIFGVICVFWSIWLLGFPKEFPLTKKQREIELGVTLSEDAVDKVVGHLFRLFGVWKFFSSLKDKSAW